MIMFIETISSPPPLVPLTADEEIEMAVNLAIADQLQEDRWVKDFIDRLAGVIEEMKH